MFIVPETAPAFSRPMSMQKDHDGGRVMSAPNMAIERNVTAPSGVKFIETAVESSGRGGVWLDLGLEV